MTYTAETRPIDANLKKLKTIEMRIEACFGKNIVG